MAHPVPSTTLDGRLRKGHTYLEHSALGVSLDSGLMEGMSHLELFELSVLNMRSVARPGDGIMKEFADWDAVAKPVPDINLDGQPMEGTTYLEPSALGVSLDSGLIKGMSRPEPLEQSVLGMLLVAQPVEALTEADMPEHPALAPHFCNWMRSRVRRGPGSSPHGGNNCSTSGRVVGPRAGLRQWTRGISARF